MGQHGEAGHVARRIHVRDVRAHLLIDLDAVRTSGRIQREFHADVLQADALEIGPATHGNEDLVAGGPAGLPFRILIDDIVPLHGDDLAAEVEFHALLLILGLEHRADLVVQRAQDLREHLHHRHLRADGIEETGELHADNAAADDDEALRLLLQGEDLPVRDHGNAEAFTKARDRRNGRLGTRADEEVAGLIGSFAADDGDTLGTPALDHRLALDDFHLGAFHLRLDTADELLDHLLLALEDRPEVDRGAVHVDAILVRMAGIIIHFGAVQQRLGGDAALVQAHAAQFPFLKKDYGETGRTGPSGRHVSAGASSDNC